MSKAATEERKALDEAQAIDQEEKKQVVLQEIASRCNDSSEFAILRQLGQALSQGQTLVCQIIAGGRTNYSYKVYVQEDEALAVYSKISFSFALWNPDRTQEYDIQRTVHEFEIIQKFTKIMGHKDAPVAKPLLLVDLPELRAKLVVTEWASDCPEQWASQFQEGRVDMEIYQKLAEALGALNLTTTDDENDVDPSFNENIRPCVQSLFPGSKERFASMLQLDKSQDDFAVQGVKAMGQEVYDKLVDKMEEEFMETREALCHNDCHQFNILFAGNDKDESNHDFILCDWEMSFAGPQGRDGGIAQSYAIACSVCHAMLGDRDKAEHLLNATIGFWDAYEQVFRKAGKSDAELKPIILKALGVIAFLNFMVYYQYGLMAEVMPLGDLPQEQASKAMAAYGAIGLEFMAIAYGEAGDSLSYSELRKCYKNIISKRIKDCLSEAEEDIEQETQKPRNRRSSIRVSSARRVSDAFLTSEAVYRASLHVPSSQTGGAPAGRRASVYDLEPLANTFPLDLLSDSADEDMKHDK